MYTTARKILLLALMATTALFAVGCQKKCQQNQAAKFQDLSDTPWRLVETNNPGQVYRNLNRFTFLIYEFTVNFRGNVKMVKNNDQYDTPIWTFVFNQDPEQELLRIQYSSTTGEEGEGTGEEGAETQSSESSSDGGTLNYSYSLTNELNLQDLDSGYYYRFVPFQGVVKPGTVCTF